MKIETIRRLNNERLATCDPALQEKMRLAISDFEARNPGAAVLVTCGYRSNTEQAKLYAQGRTRPGKIVTNAKPGQSNHNRKPSPACDVAFFEKEGDEYEVTWETMNFALFAIYAKQQGLRWGGDWKRFKDYPHFELQEKKL